MGKPYWVKICAQWVDHFRATLNSKCSDYDEIHLVFDRYDLPTSLKEAKRERHQDGKPATAYHVTDNTPVSKMSAKQFLSSTTTKDELTVYLAKKALHHFEGKQTVFIVTLRSAGTYFVTGVGNKKRVITLEPVVNALGAAKAEALPGFHAFSGANITGRFAGKGKKTFWQALNRCSMEVVSTFAAWEPVRSWVLTLNMPLKHLFVMTMSLVPL
ncbi:hypothetical protein SK128_011191 [Halocaridina rubra]|uniref:Uncharacterized protein n=1 Tax=Halocaridina rubra TaxID=373956 RepID=A0AAN8WYF1_HALRR